MRTNATEDYTPTNGFVTDPNKPVAVSQSQIETWLDCNRKWGFDKILGRRYSTPATQLGQDVHASREEWLKDGTQFDLTTKAGEIAMQGFDILPAPGTCIVEHEFRHWVRPPSPGDGGLMWHGFIDLIYQEGVPLCVDDHKTTNGRYPIKTEDDLRLDVQCNIYDAVCFHEFNAEVIRNRWHYLRTTKPFKLMGTPTIYMERDDPERLERIECIKEITFEIERARRKSLADINELPPTFGSCQKYGGCKHAEYCERTQSEDIFAHFGA